MHENAQRQLAELTWDDYDISAFLRLFPPTTQCTRLRDGDGFKASRHEALKTVAVTGY